MAKHLKSANYSFNVFNEAVVKEALAYLWVKNRPHIDAVEQIRHFLFAPRSELVSPAAVTVVMVSLGSSEN